MAIYTYLPCLNYDIMFLYIISRYKKQDNDGGISTTNKIGFEHRYRKLRFLSQKKRAKPSGKLTLEHFP